MASAFVLGLAVAANAEAQRTIHVPADTQTIQAAIDAAANGDTVLVAPGTYRETIDFKGKAITVTSSDGAAKTILDGTAGGAVVRFVSFEPLASTLNGFTIQNGSTASAADDSYGGVLIQLSGATLTNNIVTNNFCNAITVDGGSAIIDGNTISHTSPAAQTQNFACPNRLDHSGNFEGSGISLNNLTETVTVQNNTIESNMGGSASTGGAGIGIWRTSVPAVVQNNTIRLNQTLNSGSALSLHDSAGLVLVQNLIYGNSVIGYGAALDLHPSLPALGPFIGILANNTIAANTATTSTGTNADGQSASAQVFLDGSLAQWALVNNIIVGTENNEAVACGTVFNLSPTPLVFDHNDIWNTDNSAPYRGACPVQTGSFGNISADPLFANAGTNDLHLRRGSPAIDAGNNSVPMLLAKDADGLPRSADAIGQGFSTVDLGAYESSAAANPAGTVLNLSPSTYQPDGGIGFDLNASLTSSLGLPTGALTYQRDGKSIGSGTIDSSGNSTFHVDGLSPGTYAFSGSYAGQGSFSPSTSVKFYVLVGPYATTVHLSSSANPSSVNQPLTLTVRVTSVDNLGAAPITLTLSPGTTLATLSPGTTLATLTPDSSGLATFVTSSLPLGTSTITATYAGDITHASASDKLAQVVQPNRQSSVTLATSATPAVLGLPVTLSATVTPASGTPTGTVTFTDSASAFTTTVPLDGNVAASVTTSAFGVGSHTITATYSGDDSHDASSGTLVEQVILGFPTDLSLTADAASAQYGSPVSLQATVTGSGGTPTGTVIFSEGPATLASVPLAGRSALFSSTQLSLGSHPITATYSGDPTHLVSSNTFVLEVVGSYSSQIVLAVSPTPAPFGTPVVISASITAPVGTPTGEVSFSDNGSPLGSVPLANGTATFTAPNLAIGTHTLTAAYSGDPGNNPSTTTFVESITGTYATHTALIATPNPARHTDALVFDATVTSAFGTPTGNIVLSEGETTLGSIPLTQGSAAFNLASLGVGSHTLTATYSGDTLHAGSADTVIQQILGDAATKIQLTSSGSPSLRASSVTFTATGSSSTATPTGSVTFSEGPVALATATLVNGTATFSTAALGIGAHTITATLAPGPNFASSSASLVQVVQGVTSSTLITASSNTVYALVPITFRATVSEIGNGSIDPSAIQIFNDGLPMAATVIAADKSVSVTIALPAGLHLLTAIYRGDSIADGSTSAPLTITALPNPTTTVVNLQGSAPTAFQPFIALVTTTSQTAPATKPDGYSSIAVLSAGSINAQAVPSSSSPAGTPMVLGAGTYSILGSYIAATPPGNFLSSTSAPQSLVIARAPSSLTVTGPLPAPTPQNQPITLAALTAGLPGHTPTGSVGWVADGTASGTSDVDPNGAVSLSLAGLAGGSHTVVLTYSGDVNYLPAITAPIPVEVIRHDFLIKPDPTISIPAQHHGTMTVALNSLGDFAGDIQLSCAGLPRFATCTFDKPMVSLIAGSTTSVSLTIETDQFPGFVANIEPEPHSRGMRLTALAALSPLALLGLFAARRQRTSIRLLHLAAALLLATGSLTLAGCGSRTPGFTPPGSYPFQIVATSPTITHSQSATLIVTGQ